MLYEDGVCTVCCVMCTAPVEESPTIYSVFVQENQKDKRSEKEELVVRSSTSASAVTLGANKKNIQLNKKAPEKKKDKQYTLEDALQEVVLF